MGKSRRGDFSQDALRGVQAATHDPQEERDRDEMGLDLPPRVERDDYGQGLQKSYEAAQRATRDPEVMARAWAKIAEKRRSAESS